MRTLRNVFSVYAAIGVLVLGLGVGANAQQISARQVGDLVRSLNSRIDDFRFNMDEQLRAGSVRDEDADDLRRSVANLQEKVTAFDENQMQRRENRDDVVEIITAAKDVEAFFRQGSSVNRTLELDWKPVHNLIDRLAASYRVTPDWNGRVSNYPGNRGNTNNYPSTSPRTYPSTSTGRTGTFANGLTGTYRLNTGRSENIADLISGKNINADQRDDLETKLEAPEQIALDIRGTRVILASSKTQPVTFTADGSTRSEQIGGRNMQLRASMRGGQDLVVSTHSGESDFTITFSPTDSGRGLKVTRRVTTEYLSETVLAESYYDKTESVAGLGIDPSMTGSSSDNEPFSSNDPDDRPRAGNSYPTINHGRSGAFIVPNGTTVTAILDNEINTNVSHNNDRFKMIVQSPSEFRGAVIEGHLTGVGRSGQVSGRSNVTFNFDRISLRNGQTYDFGGTLLSVKDQNGKDVKVDSEGTAKGQSQTKETAKRGGLGAGLGAIIGAIAGGGTGAAVGAIIGGGVGAGSVVVQGRDDLRLLKGSTVTISSSSPIRNDQPVSEN